MTKKPLFLVVQAARFGDLVQTGGLIKSLQKKGVVHICLDVSLKGLAALLFPEAILHGVNFHKIADSAAIRENIAVFDDLSRNTYTQVYNCNFSPLTAALCRLFPASILSAYRASRHADGALWRSEWMRLFFRFSSNRRISSFNLVDVWRLLSSGALPPEKINPVACGGGKGVGVVLAGRESRRSLPAPVLAQIITICARKLKNPPLRLFGTEQEKILAHKLLRLLPPDIQLVTKDLSGKTGWPELIAELKGLDLLLSPDTGTMHLGASLGVPVMAFFLSSAWAHETGPYGAGHLVWQSVQACSPCLEKEACPHGLRCLEPFSSKAFQKALVQVLSASRVECPEGLQLWQTAFDRAGQTLSLLAGKDPDREVRLTARNLTIDKFNLADNVLDIFSAQKLKDIQPLLFPESEWMLPPWRYC